MGDRVVGRTTDESVVVGWLSENVETMPAVLKFDIQVQEINFLTTNFQGKLDRGVERIDKG